MKRKYPKNRKPGSGRPLPKATDHKLDCRFCGGMQNLSLIDHIYLKYKKDNKLRIMTYACDHCTRRLRIYKTVDGYYRVQHSFDKRKKWQNQHTEEAAV